MIAAFQKGDVEHARDLNARLMPSHLFQSTDDAPNPIPAKAMLRTLGLPGGQCRLPMGPGPRGSRTAPAGSLTTCMVDQGDTSPASEESGPVRVVFLGGLGEIGRNCACIEVGGRIMLLDCGLMFPDTEMPGIDLVLPDFSYLRENADRVEGCIITHGHEDHCGGLSFLLRELSFPIYGSELTLGLARSRIEEAGLLDRTKLIPVRDGERRQIGPFDVEFIPVTHSVPHGFATAFHTPAGVILHSGDFKIDLTPVDGRSTDLAHIGALADGPGVKLLLSDSTNAEEEGHSSSERRVGRVLADLFAAHPDKRVIMACFASHIHRIQQIADAAIANGRTIATLGRSMGKNVALARSMGLLSIPEDRLIDIERIGDVRSTAGVRDLDRVAGRAHVGPVTHGLG